MCENMRKVKRISGMLAFLLIVLLILPGAGLRSMDETAPYIPAAQKYYEENQEQFESYEGFLKLDRETIESASGPLGLTRFITEGEYTLGTADAKYDLDPNYEVSTEGLDTLNISGSVQFSVSQFRTLADDLRRLADGRQIVIVDLRAESHCFLNGVPVSWQEMNNWGNLFLTLDEIEADEAERFEPLLGQTVQVSGTLPSSEPSEITVTSVMSEKELVESEGFTYLRIDCSDHSFPTPAEIDAFIDFVKSVDTDDTWFHFHCGGGKGRTGVFMMLYDKMKNPQVSDKDIMYRQAQMGSNYPIYTGTDANAPMYAEKAEMTPILYRYVEENAADGYAVSWTEWLSAELAPETYVVQEGDSLDSIAEEQGVTTMELALLNRDTIIKTAQENGYECEDVTEYAKYVFPGEELMLPDLTERGSLQAIRERGYILVGTAGDYQPMSYLDPDTGEYVGFDAELAEDLAEELGVVLVYVPTTWPTLMEDLSAGRFDAAICGITITEARQEQALMSDGYLANGKTVLCRAEDADKYTSLEAINRPEVRVMENPGGLNEKFAKENLPDATLIIHDVNQEIPGLIASGEADVMITEIMEAGYYVGQDSRLAAPLIHEPFTSGQLGVLMPKDADELLEYVNGFLAEERAGGRLDELADEYIYRFITEELDQAA